MLKLSRFIKPFLAGIALAIVLLAIQAICELNLPNYMSKIVNVGIQQGGVEEPTPKAISQDGYTFITTFMDDGERAVMRRSYELVWGDEKDGDGKPYSEAFPKAADEQIYVLRQGLSDEERAQADSAFGTATWTMVNFLKRLQEESTAAGLDTSEFLGATGSSDRNRDSTDIQALDFTKIYQFQPILDRLPREWFDEAHEQAVNMEDSLRTQSGVMLVGGFYRELGCDMTALEINYIVYIGLIMLLITAVSGVASILVGYLSSRIGAGVARNMRKAIFAKVTGFSHAEFDRFSTASLITRSTNDVMVIQMMLTMGIRMICYAPIMGIGGVFMALGKSVSMSWIIGVAAVVLIGIVLVLFAVVMPKFKIMQTLIDRLNLVARESLNGLMVIRAFSRADFEEERFEVANRNLTQTNLFVGRAMTFMMPIMMLFMNGLTILIIWVGSQQVAQSQMQVGDMMAYMQYVMQIMMSFMFIAMLFVFIPRAMVSANRLNEVLETEPSIIDPVQPRHMDPTKRGLVEFRDVSFRYQEAKEDALCHIAFTARPGQKTALIGSTGSGKSTVINLIPRFYDATEGEVMVGGINVRDLTQEELRSAIGYVPQQSVLMAGTIESNITYGSGELPKEDLEKIAEVSQALEFINENEERFDLAVSQSGSSVSGGQRQRLSIARALAVKPDIYLFDDSFSALDFKTDAVLRKALAEYAGNSTIIIVAQRVSTIMDADQILVIDDGRIVGSGTHKELLSTCAAYLEIASSQLSESELIGRGGE